MRCPYCNGETPHIEPEKLAEVVPGKGAQRVVLATLLRRIGRPVRSDFLLQQMYSGPDGGPTNALNVLAVTVSHLRKRLSPHGFTIKGEPGPGGDSCYRLTPMSPHSDTTEQREVA